jgi:hypothetical protein
VPWLGWGLDELGVAQQGNWHVLAFKDEAEGRGVTAEVGLDDLEAARAIEGGLGTGSGRAGWGRDGRDRQGAGPTEGEDGAGGGAEVDRTAEVAGGDAVGGGGAGPGRLAQVVNDEEGEVYFAGNGGEEAEGGAGTLEAGLAAGSGGGQGIDDDEGWLQCVAHLGELVLVEVVVQVDEVAGAGGDHEVEAAAVDVPGADALVEEGGRALGVDDEDLAAGTGDGGAIGEGPAVDDAAGEVEGDEGLAGAGGGAKEGDHTTGDPGGPEPVDVGQAGGHFVEGGVGAEGVFSGQQFEEGGGQMVLVIKAPGGPPDDHLGILGR